MLLAPDKEEYTTFFEGHALSFSHGPTTTLILMTE